MSSPPFVMYPNPSFKASVQPCHHGFDYVGNKGQDNKTRHMIVVIIVIQ